MRHPLVRFVSKKKPTLLRAMAAAASLLIVVTATAVPADGFGTVAIPGQRVVHEPITRTLSCGANARVNKCFEHASMTMLAGTNGTYGGVGIADDFTGGLGPASKHCDDADYGYGDPQPQSVAWQELSNCLYSYQRYMDFAVTSAAGMLNADGTVNARAVDIFNSTGGTYDACALIDPLKGKSPESVAKCNVISGFGRALHVYEDFWSHSNWGDYKEPGVTASMTSPVGLAEVSQPTFFKYPSTPPTQFPEKLITGCDDSTPFDKFVCGKNLPPTSPLQRVKHSTLNKDGGSVNPDTCSGTTPITPRGEVVAGGIQNFTRVVKGACAAARASWSDLQAQLVKTYGTQKATTMIRALTSDTPLTTCIVGGSAARALVPPVGPDPNSARGVDITLTNGSTSRLTCSKISLEGGEWAANYPSDSVTSLSQWRTQSHGIATGTEGSATFIGTDGSTVTMTWNNPYYGSNSYGCTTTGNFVCMTDGSKGNNSTVKFTLNAK